MVAAPTGTVTLLFTDIEGSTRLVHDLGIERFERVLSDHARIVRETIAAKDGHEARTEGDSFFVVFRSARQAAAAAADMQRRLSRHEWPFGVGLRVRMGMHAGEAAPASPEAGSDYLGYAVHLAARVAAAAHGGQVLLTDTVRSLIEGELPAGTSLRDLGEHRLKDTPPGRLYQLVIEGVPSDFPPLRTAALRPNNLPTSATPFIGRGPELEGVRRSLRDPGVRLLTLTGPGGTGKTRLALEAAARLLTEFEDGVFLVPLGSVTDPALVPLAIARTIGVQEASGQPILESLVRTIGTSERLLVLDNFEQVAEAAPLTVELLARCPRLKLLVTSRSPLFVSAEHELPVDPLPIPGGADERTDRILEYASVALFVDRARALRPDLALTPDDLAAIAEICARLDGLPLAIELAAARIRALSPHEIASRLHSRLALLTGGPRDLPARQRTLRDTLAWSYELLDPPERQLFRRLAVFASSWTVDAAEAVCGRDLGVDLLDGLESLVRHSLLRRIPGTGHARFGMLETVREYAEELLVASGEADAMRRAHAGHYLRLAEDAEPRFETAELVEVLHELDAERDEIRVVLERSIAGGDVDRAARIAGAIAWSWWIRGHLTEGRAVLERILALPGAGERDGRRAKVLLGAGIIANWQRDHAPARAWIEEAVSIWRERGDDARVCEALHWLGDAHLSAGDPQGAGAHYVEGIRIAQATGRQFTLLTLRAHVGLNLLLAGDLARARATLEEILPAAERLGNQWARAILALSLALTYRAGGDELGAHGLLQRALVLLQDIADRNALLLALFGLAGTRAALGDRASAFLLGGAAEAEFERLGSSAPPIFTKVAAAPAVPAGDAEAARAYAQGRAMRIDEAVAYALSLTAEPPRVPEPAV